MPTSSQPQFGRQMHTRVPPRVQQIMAKKLERSVPGYMKQYIGPYMQQEVVHPQIAGQSMASPSVSPAPTLHASSGESWRQSHFKPTDSPQPVAVQPQQAVQPSDPYSFIMEPEAPKRSLSLPGSGSMVTRIGLAAGGLLVLLIIFSIVKGLISGPSNLSVFLPIAQDQQEMIHLLTNASQEQSLSTQTQNFVATAQLSLTSNQSNLIQYLTNNGYKVPTKSLGLRISTSLDSQLSNAIADSTYEQTFKSTMNSQINTYIVDLKAAYVKTSGKHGRDLLNSDYNQAQLLLTQLQ